MEPWVFLVKMQVPGPPPDFWAQDFLGVGPRSLQVYGLPGVVTPTAGRAGPRTPAISRKREADVAAAVPGPCAAALTGNTWGPFCALGLPSPRFPALR